MKLIKFLWNVYKSIRKVKSHPFAELRLFEFDNKGNLKSFTTKWYDLPKYLKEAHK